MAFHRPNSLSSALAIAAKGGMRMLAGGTDLFPATDRPALDGDILDLSGLCELRGVLKTSEGWRIGALTTWREVIAADLPCGFGALKAAAREVGSPQVQAAGTVGGNLCNASPAADGVPPLMAMDAEVEIAAPAGPRRLPLADFLVGPRRTALARGELLAAVHVRHADAAGRSAFLKLGSRRYLVISIAAVAARLEMAAGKVERAAVAVGACSPVAVRLAGLEAALIGASPLRPDRWRAALTADLAARLQPISDIRADAAYRLHAAAELVERVLAEAAEAD